MHRLIALLLFVACGPSGAAPPAENPPAESEPTRGESVNTPDRTSQEQGVPGTACEYAFDCDIVHDNCGAPHARALGDDTESVQVELCPPVGYAPTEPACDGGVCVASPVEDQEMRRCEAASECVVIRGLCGVPWAVSASMRSEAQIAVRRRGAAVNCMVYAGEMNLRAECREGFCIARR